MPKFSMLFLIAVALFSSGVFAQEQKSNSNNERHTLAVETDSGRYGVSSDKLDSKQLGVAIYPGAKVSESDNDKKGANLSLDWGGDSMRLFAQKYITSDSAEQVLTFYRKELSKFGAVLECRNGKAVAPVASKLKCEDQDNDKDNKGIELKAGTEKKQHIVGVTPKGGGTEFGVVYLEKTTRAEL